MLPLSNLWQSFKGSSVGMGASLCSSTLGESAVIDVITICPTGLIEYYFLSLLKRRMALHSSQDQFPSVFVVDCLVGIVVLFFVFVSLFLCPCPSIIQLLLPMPEI